MLVRRAYGGGRGEVSPTGLVAGRRPIAGRPVGGTPVALASPAVSPQTGAGRLRSGSVLPVPRSEGVCEFLRATLARVGARRPDPGEHRRYRARRDPRRRAPDEPPVPAGGGAGERQDDAGAAVPARRGGLRRARALRDALREPRRAGGGRRLA